MFPGFALWGANTLGLYDPDNEFVELWSNDRAYALTMFAGIKGLGVQVPICTPSWQPGEFADITQAPWYQENNEASSEFGGIFVQSIDGFDKYGYRDVEANSEGSVSSGHKLHPKTLTVKAVLFGKTCKGAQYGYRWLLSQLYRKDCDTNFPYSVLIIKDDLTDEQGTRGMFDVRVSSDPEIVEKFGSCCECCDSTTLSVEWTFVCENPKMYYIDAIEGEGLEYSFDFNDGEINCIDWECENCNDFEYEYAIPIVLPKTRYPVKVLANNTWCPVGNWELSDYFDNPEAGYLEIVDSQLETNPLNIYIAHDGTFCLSDYQNPAPNLMTTDLCKLNIQIAQYAPNPAVTQNTHTDGSPLVDASPKEKVKLAIKLLPTDGTSGIWQPQGWTKTAGLLYPPPGAEFFIDQGCECSDHSNDCQIVLNENLTWSPQFEYTGSFPPLGCSSVSIADQSPGQYLSTQILTPEEAFNGRMKRTFDVEDSYSGVVSGYCQPSEWYQFCIDHNFPDATKRYEPMIIIEGQDSNDSPVPLYNIKFEFINKDYPDDTCFCDSEFAICDKSDYEIRIGHSLLQGNYYYDPMGKRIFVNPVESEYQYDASGITSGKNGGSPWGISFGDCSGVCVLVTVEIVRDENGDIISPVPEPAFAGFQLGFIPYDIVGT